MLNQELNFVLYLLIDKEKLYLCDSTNVFLYLKNMPNEKYFWKKKKFDVGLMIDCYICEKDMTIR